MLILTFHFFFLSFCVFQVKSLVDGAVSQGAEVIVGGSCDNKLGELFYQPTVLTRTTLDMKLAHEEIFGPVAPIIK